MSENKKVAKEFADRASLSQYLKDHPKADPKHHSVQNGKAPAGKKAPAKIPNKKKLVDPKGTKKKVDPKSLKKKVVDPKSVKKVAPKKTKKDIKKQRKKDVKKQQKNSVPRKEYLPSLAFDGGYGGADNDRGIWKGLSSKKETERATEAIDSAFKVQSDLGEELGENYFAMKSSNSEEDKAAFREIQKSQVKKLAPNAKAIIDVFGKNAPAVVIQMALDMHDSVKYSGEVPSGQSPETEQAEAMGDYQSMLLLMGVVKSQLKRGEKKSSDRRSASLSSRVVRSEIYSRFAALPDDTKQIIMEQVKSRLSGAESEGGTPEGIPSREDYEQELNDYELPEHLSGSAAEGELEGQVEDIATETGSTESKVIDLMGNMVIMVQELLKASAGGDIDG